MVTIAYNNAQMAILILAFKGKGPFVVSSSTAAAVEFAINIVDQVLSLLCKDRCMYSALANLLNMLRGIYTVLRSTTSIQQAAQCADAFDR